MIRSLIPVLGLPLFLQYSCISVPIKPQGQTSNKLMTIDKSSKLSQSALVSGLSRSTLLPGEIYEAVYVEATLQSPALEYRKFERQAKLENWNEKERSQALEELHQDSRRHICFSLLVKSNHELSKDENNWQVSLQQDGKSQTLAGLRFSETSGGAKLATTAFSHVRNDMKYFLESELCFDRSHELVGKLVLIVDPKFDKNSKAATLTWKFKS